MKKSFYYYVRLGSLLSVFLLYGTSTIKAQQTNESTESIQLEQLEKENKIAQNKAKKEIEAYYKYNYKELRLNRELMTKHDYYKVRDLNKYLWNEIKFKLKNTYNNDYVNFLKGERGNLENYRQEIADGIGTSISILKFY